MLTKTCLKCKKPKPLAEFSKHPRGRQGLHPRCNTCRSEDAKRYYANLDKHKHGRTNKKSWLKRAYGLTVADFDRMKSSQGERCALCNRAPTKGKFHVDHDHQTGQVRALLCWRCNVGLGSFLDNPSMLRKAADYLEKWRNAVVSHHTPLTTGDPLSGRSQHA